MRKGCPDVARPGHCTVRAGRCEHMLREGSFTSIRFKYSESLKTWAGSGLKVRRIEILVLANSQAFLTMRGKSPKLRLRKRVSH